MKRWFKKKILEWLTEPESMQDKNQKFLDKVKQETDVKYEDDSLSKTHISINELNDAIFNDDIVMFVIGKTPEGKWLYYARPKYKHEKRAQ